MQTSALDISPSRVLDGTAQSLEANWGGAEHGFGVIWASNRADTQLRHTDGVKERDTLDNFIPPRLQNTL